MTDAPSYLSMIIPDEEHGAQFSSKSKASSAAHIESQRTGVKHTHYLTSTWRGLVERLCWTVIPVSTAKRRLDAAHNPSKGE